MRNSRELDSSEFINLLNVRFKFKKKKNGKKFIKKFEKLIQIFEYTACSYTNLKISIIQCTLHKYTYMYMYLKFEFLQNCNDAHRVIISIKNLLKKKRILCWYKEVLKYFTNCKRSINCLNIFYN